MPQLFDENVRLRHRGLLLFLMVAGFFVFSFSLQNDFIPLWDDTAYVIANADIQGFSVANIKAVFSKFYVGNYAPLQMMTYMFDYTLWGMRPAGFIASNICLHTLNGMLLYLLCVRSNLTRTVAFAAACIFLFHPVQVESVVWISQRKSVLAICFLLISFHCYLSYRDVLRGRKRLVFYLFSLAAFVAALLSKSVVVVMPLMLALHDVSFAEKKRNILDKLPYLALAVTASVITIFSQSPSELGGRTSFHGGSPLATFFTMLTVMCHYFKLLFFPVGLSLRYDVSIHGEVDGYVAAAALVMAGVMAAGYYLFWNRRELFFWYACFFVGLLPVAQIIPIVTLINDRYLYAPLIGGAPFVAGAVASFSAGAPQYKRWLVLFGCVLLMLLAVMTIRRQAVWENSLTMWQDIVQKNDRDRDAWQFLINEYRQRNQWHEVLAAAKQSLEFFPYEVNSLKMAGIASLNTGEVLQARRYFEHAVAVSSNDIELLYLLADGYRATGERQLAMQVYITILNLSPLSEQALKGVKELKGGAY